MTPATDSSDLETLKTIFADRPALHSRFLAAVLAAHSNLSQACDYLSSLPDAHVPPPSPRSRSSSRTNIQRQQRQLTRPFIDFSDPVAAQTVLDNVKSILIPTLTSHLTGLQLPDHSESTDRATFSLSGMTVNSIRLVDDDVTVTPNPTSSTVDIVADAVDVHANIDSWMYRLNVFPRLSDSGHATLALRGLHAHIRLCLTPPDNYSDIYDSDAVATDNNSAMLVDHCECHVRGDVSLRADDARFSWFYNVVATVARGPLRRAVEIALQDAIRESLNDQLADWSSWLSGAVS